MRGNISWRTVLVFSLAVAILGLVASPAGAAITFDSFFSWDVGPDTYDASGSDKLIVVITGENGNPGDLGGNVIGITYNGQTLIKAVDISPSNPATGGHGQTTSDIWYLDNPGNYTGTGTIVPTVTSNGNNFVYTAIGLSGTAPGVGATATVSGAASVDLTTTAFDSMVISLVGMGGIGNTANPAGITATSPTGVMRFTGLEAGTNWAGHVVARTVISSPSLQAYSFNNTRTDIVTLAAEFQAYVPTLYWDIDGATPGAGGSAPGGVWNATAPNWNDDSTGGGVATQTWLAGYTARFGAGGDANGIYTVTVDGTQGITGLAFEEGTVTLANGTNGALQMTGNALMSVASGLTATVETAISEDGGGSTPWQLRKTGAGTLILSGDLSYTGGTNVIDGTLVLSGDNSAASGGMAINGGVAQFESPASINGTARDVAVNSGGTVVFGAAFGDANIPAALANRIAASSVGVIAADNYAATNFDFATPGLTAASLGAVASVTYTGTLTPNGGVYRLGGGGGMLTMANANAVTGTGSSLEVRGSGTVVLSAANDYDGGTTLIGGTLIVGDAGSLGSGALTITGGAVGAVGTVVTTNAVNANGDFSLAGPGVLTLGDMTLSANRTITNNNGAATTTFGNIGGADTTLTFTGIGSTTVAGVIATGSGGLVLSNGTLTLANDNTYTGTTTVTDGTLVLMGANSTSGVTLNVINYHAGTVVIGNAGALGSGTFTITGGGATTVQAAGSVVISNAVALNNNLIIGGDGALTLGGTMTLGGSRTVTNNNTTSATTFGNIAGTNSTTTFSGNGDTSVTGAIDTGTGTLTKNGTGTLTLSGTNTYTGATAVSNGTLLVNGDNSAATGTVTVAAAGRLSGEGIIGGAVIVSGTLAPGASIGELTVANNVTMAENSTYEWQNGPANADKVVVTGDLALPVVWTLKLMNEGDMPAGQYDLFSFGGSLLSYADPTVDYGDTGWTIDDVTVELVSGRIYLSFGPVAVLGDTDGNGVVDAADFITLKKNFGAGVGGDATIGDFDGGGTVDWADLSTLMTNMGVPGDAPAMTPEPATLGLLAIGALAMLRRNRRS